MIGRIEADQGDKQANVGFHQLRAEQEGAAAFKAALQRVQHGKNLFKGFVIGFLRGGEAGAIDAVVEMRINLVVQRVDSFAQCSGIKVEPIVGETAEAGIEHPENIGGIHC